MKNLEELKQLPWCSDYISYLEFRKSGLKKEAQKSLNCFFENFKEQNKNARREFIDSVNNIAFLTQDYSLYLPYNLVNEIINPEIQEWITEEPNNAIPYKWSYNFDLVKKSLTMDPHDQVVLTLFGKMVINKIDMNQHEIHHGYPYDGNPNQDIDLIVFYMNYINSIKNISIKELYIKKLTQLKKSAFKYNKLD